MLHTQGSYCHHMLTTYGVCKTHQFLIEALQMLLMALTRNMPAYIVLNKGQIVKQPGLHGYLAHNIYGV